VILYLEGLYCEITFLDLLAASVISFHFYDKFYQTETTVHILFDFNSVNCSNGVGFTYY
jgi:hypothetical protein